MTDREQSDIYKDVNDKLDEIDFKILGCVDTRRDDRDCIEAAMITISKYLNEDKATLRNIGYDVGDRNDASYKLVFEPYLNLLRELYDEFKDLENNGTNHYIRTQENDHLQRLAGRIDNAERLVLINQDVYIAKREIAVGNSYLTYIPVPGKPELTYINTPPICNSNCNTKGEKDKVTISDVLQKSNAEAIKGNTFTIDYSECTNPTLKSLGKKVVDENGKDIRTGKDLQAWEGVKVLSSRYIEAREEYSNSLNNPLYHNGGNVGQLPDQLEENNDVLMDYRTETGDVGFSKFLAGIENIPQYKGCVRILQSCGLYKYFEKLYNKNGSKNAYPVIKFLSATETKLEQIIAKNKAYGFELSTLPIEKTDTGEPGIIQANFQGGKRTIKEVFFYDGKHGKNQGSCIRITQALYNFIDEHDDEVVQYLTQRIREKRDDNKYDNLIIKQKVTTETINIDKDDSEIQKNLQLKNYGLDQLIRSCESFKNTYTDHQPTELTALIKYLSNLKYDLNNGFNHGKMPTDKERENQYNEISELWINFKDHDGNFALFMKDETAKEYIKNILYAEDKETIEVNIKHLTNGMTVFDNTAGNSAVEDAMFNGIYGEGKEELQVENNEINKCIAKIKKDFTVTYDESGNITSNTTAMDEMLSERDKFNTDIQTLHQRNIKDSEKYQKRSGVFKYLKRKGYIPETAEIDYTGEINEICGKIWIALYQKQELLKSDNRKLTPAKLEERYSQEKYDLQKRSNLSKKEKERLETLEAIEDIGYDSDEVKEIIEDENKKAEKSIKYGDMLYIIGGSLGNYFIEAGNGISGGSEIAKMLNDSKGIGSFDLSDETNEQIAPLVASIIEEVIICAVAMAVGTFTAGVGTAGILAAGRALRIVNLCRKLTTGEKYLNRIATIIRRAKNIKKATIASEFANEWKAGKTLKNLYELGKTASAGGLGGRTKISSMIFEGTGFHISSTMLHNALENKSFTEGLDPTENWKEYIESIAFLGVLKMISGPGGIGSLTQDGIEKIMRSKVNRFFKSLFTGGLSLSSEMLGLSATDQILSIVFDQQFKSITVDEFIHMLGMCLGLRVLGKVTKLIVKDKNKKGEYTVEAETKDGERIEVVTDKDGNVLRKKEIDDKKGETKENGEKAKREVDEEFEKAKREVDEEFEKAKTNERENQSEYNKDVESLESREGPTNMEEIKHKTKEEQYKKIYEFRSNTEFMSEHDLYKIFDERISACKSEGEIEEFIVKRNATLEYFSGNEVRFRDPKTKEIVEGKNIFDYGKSLFGDKFQTPECQKLRKVMEEFMFNQTLDNPLQYNSHGFDHSILVDAYSQMVIEKKSIEIVSEKYGISSEGAEVLLRLSAVFHDFGYPEIVKIDTNGNVTLKMDKSMHGLEGGLLFENEIAPAFREVMKLYGAEGTKLDQAVTDMRDAISYHSADKIEEPPYKFKLHTNKGEILINEKLNDECVKWLKDSYCKDGDIVEIHTQDGAFNENSPAFKELKSKLESQGIKVNEKCIIDEPTNRYTTSVEVEGTVNQYYRGRIGHKAEGWPIGIEIQPIDLYDSPLAGVVRFADNMDMAFNRLSEVQKNPVFMDLMYNLGMDAVWDGKGNPPASKIFQEMEGLKNAAEKVGEGKLTPEEFKTKIDEFLSKYGEITTLELFTYDAKTGTRNPDLSGTMEFNSDWKTDIEGLKSKEVSSLEKEALKIVNKFKESLVTKLNDLEYPEGGPRGKNQYFDVIKGVSQEKKTGSYSLRHVAGLTCIEDVCIHNGNFMVTLDPKVYYDSALSRQTVREKGESNHINVNDYHIWRLFDASSKVTIDGQVSNIMMIDAQNNLMGVITRCSENGKFKPYYTLFDGNGNIVKNTQGKAIFVENFSDAQTYYQLSTIETSADFSPKDRQDMLNSIIKDGKTFAELQEINKDIKGLKEGDNIDNYKDDSRLLNKDSGESLGRLK